MDQRTRLSSGWTTVTWRGIKSDDRRRAVVGMLFPSAYRRCYLHSLTVHQDKETWLIPSLTHVPTGCGVTGMQANGFDDPHRSESHGEHRAPRNISIRFAWKFLRPIQGEIDTLENEPENRVKEDLRECIWRKRVWNVGTVTVGCGRGPNDHFCGRTLAFSDELR